MALKWYKFQFFHVGIKLDLFYHIKHKNSIKLYIFIDLMYIYLAVLLPKNLVNGEVSKSARIWLSKSIFYVKNHPTLSNFFSQKNTNSGPHFSLTFFDKINFQITLLLKWGHIFDSSPIIQNSKFNKFLWVWWFLCKNLSNFIPPAWKLHNPYCHNWHICQNPVGVNYIP